MLMWTVIGFFLPKRLFHYPLIIVSDNRELKYLKAGP